jgi:hypothetical protein
MATTTYERRPGWITFAAVLLFAVAFTRVISGINYLGDGSQINDLTNSVFGQHLWLWGIWDLTLALLAFAAGVSLLGGGGFGRVFAYVWAIWAIVQSFLIIGVAPWFAAATIVLATLVIYGLASSSDWSGGDLR